MLALTLGEMAWFCRLLDALFDSVPQSPPYQSYQTYTTPSIQLPTSHTDAMIICDILWHTLHALVALVGFSATVRYMVSAMFIGWHSWVHIAVPTSSVNVHPALADQNHAARSRYLEVQSTPANPQALPVALFGYGKPATTSMTTLPAELLILVFEAVLVPGNTVQTFALLRCSHVCRGWRCVILTSRSLWALALDVGHPNALFNVELLRSKPVLLDFCADLPRLPPEHLTRAISNLGAATRHLLRIRTFSVRSAGNNIMSLIDSGCWLSANVLETFSLHNTLAPLYTDTAPILPRVFMGLYAPRLRELQLWGCAFDWADFRFANLRHLSVHHTPPWAKPSQDQLISSLHVVPHLKSLTLHDVLSAAEEHSSSLTATLTDLQSIDVLGSIIPCTKLLLCLNLPSLQDITCVLRCPDGAPSGYTSPLFQVISAMCIHLRPITTVLRCIGDEIEVRVAGPSRQECLVIHLFWSSPPLGQDMLLTLISLCRTLPLAQTQTLHFDAYAQCSSRALFWTELFTCFPAATSLYLLNDDDTPEEIMDVLITDTFNVHGMMQIGRSLPVLLPALKAIYIRWVSHSLYDQSQHFSELRDAISLSMEVWPRETDPTAA